MGMCGWNLTQLTPFAKVQLKQELVQQLKLPIDPVRLCEPIKASLPEEIGKEASDPSSSGHYLAA